ncbi:hypothetical protein Tco_0261579 [Tanacetum coccineum]
MAVLESCPKHNMVAYLEKTDGNTEFHEIISFLTRSSIHYALTVSPVVSTTFVEQFWMSAKSKIINNVRYITAKVAGKPVSISKASIRSDLFFDNADGSILYQIVFLDTQLKNVHVPLDHFPINALTSKVLSFMVKKGNHFLGNVTPLFDSMLVQPTEDEGDTLERQSEPQPIPSPPHLKGSGGNHGGQFSIYRSLSWNEGGMTLQSVYDFCISLCTQMAWERNLKNTVDAKESVSKQRRKPAKAEPTIVRGRTSYVVHEEKESAEKGVSTEDPLSTAQPKVSTNKPEDSIDKPDKGTDKPKVSTDKEEVSTDKLDEVLIIMSQNKEKLKEKEKGIELKDVEETERPRPSSTRSLLTLNPLPKIDPKDKGKKMIEEKDESDTDSEDIIEAEKKFKQLARDEEVARKVQEDWEAKEEEEREMYTIEQRAKFLHDTIAIQRRFLAQQRSEAIRNKPPLRNQLRNQMMTYLKHVGGKKHSDLKTKGFEEIKALYDKIKRSDDSFIAIGSAEDEKVIKEMNEQVADASKKRVKKDDSIKGEIKEEEGTRKRKLGIRKKMKSKKRKFTSKDDEELRLCLTIVSDEDKEVDYEILDKKYPIIEWRSEYLTTKPQYDETEEIEDVYLNVVIRSNRQRRYFSTLMAVLSILDRDDICAIYQLVMNRYQDETPEGFDKILWGDLIIMFNQSGNDEFWNAQQNWKIVSWKLHSSSGIHTIMTDEGIVIHMLVENKYPLKKEVLSQLLKLKLETEEDSTMALELIRFVKKQIAELEPEDSDGDEKDL